MPNRILHGRPVPAECAVVKVTTIREGCHEFEELDYPNEEDSIEELVILWPRKDTIVKTCLSLIVSPWSTEAGGTPTSNMPLPIQDPHTSATPPPAQEPQYLELQDSTGKRPPSPPAQDPELQTSMRKGCLLLLLKIQSSRTALGKGHLHLLLKIESSRTARGKDCILLMLKT
jgi:hypothetical protein